MGRSSHLGSQYHLAEQLPQNYRSQRILSEQQKRVTPAGHLLPAGWHPDQSVVFPGIAPESGHAAAYSGRGSETPGTE